MVGGAALLAAAAVFYAVNYPAAVSTAATTRQLPIYSVERAQKVCAISFDAAWGEGKVRHGCREREQDRAISAWGIRLSSLNTHQEKAAKSPCRRFCSFLRLLLPSINKSSHGFDGQKCAHTASSPLAIRQVFPAGLFLSGRISAPTKLLAPGSDVFSSDFWFLRRRLADASQGEKGKKHRKDTLSGVVALVNRWYPFIMLRKMRASLRSIAAGRFCPPEPPLPALRRMGQCRFPQHIHEPDLQLICLRRILGEKEGRIDPVIRGVLVHEGKLSKLNVQHILVNDKMETNVPGVYAIGDCVFGHAQLAHTASAMGEVAAENICGHEAHYCEKTNPTCVYMEPEAASVGLTEEQCKAQGIAYKVGKFPMSANGKALILNGGEGLVKIIAGAEYGEILGMHIIGPRATDLIAEGALAIEGEMTLDEIIDTIHSHPTVTETMREAALNAEKRAIHTKN